MGEIVHLADYRTTRQFEESSCPRNGIEACVFLCEIPDTNDPEFCADHHIAFSRLLSADEFTQLYNKVSAIAKKHDVADFPLVAITTVVPEIGLCYLIVFRGTANTEVAIISKALALLGYTVTPEIDSRPEEERFFRFG